jgi:hypothetical protein
VNECKPLHVGDRRRVRRAARRALRRSRGALVHGEAVQVDPMKLNLKPPGTERLKLKCDDPLSIFAFNFTAPLQHGA